MDSQMKKENLQAHIRDSIADGQGTESAIRVSAEEYDWLIKKLEEPAQDIPTLRALLTNASVWKG